MPIIYNIEDGSYTFTATVTLRNGEMVSVPTGVTWGDPTPQDPYPGFVPPSGGWPPHPCCPLGCDPCGRTYYKLGTHPPGCCDGSICASRQQIKATQQWLEKWYKAEEEYLTIQWLQAEHAHKFEVLRWLDREQEFLASLVERKPQIRLKERQPNSPSKAKQRAQHKQRA